MIDLSLGTSAVIALALTSALCWGISDFGGGMLGRRGPVLGVLLFTQGLGCVIALSLTVIRGEPFVAGTDLGLTIIAGLLATVGIGSFYHALAIGRMGIVAPVAAVLTALAPALISTAFQGIPPSVVIAGMGLAIVAVVIVSAVPDHTPDRPTGLPFAVLGGILFGLLGFTMSRISETYVMSPLALQRLILVTAFGVIAVVGRRPWRLPRATWLLVVVVGCLDLIGNVAFLAAVRSGHLAIAAIVSSLYPVITVLLAATILRERMTLSHAAGVALAGVAVAMITGGSAG